MVRGFLINKFRGDPALFDDGRRAVIERTGWADLGMAPWLAAARRLPSEDTVVLGEGSADPRGKVSIVVPMLSRIANFDEFDALRNEPSVDFSFIPPGAPLPGDADLVILPGTKSTLSDLAFLRAQGWDIDLRAHLRRGGRVLGVCGGYQMLGRRIADPNGVDGAAGVSEGLGLLDVETVMTGDKTLRPVTGRLVNGARFAGYEMHVGRTTASTHPLLRFDDGTTGGAISIDGRVSGGYVHGLFDQGEARAALLAELGAASNGLDQSVRVDQALDEIAGALETAFDIAALSRIAGLEA